jgi:mRNA-degrading endonuclease RelE of RelBE toxin-antitoxin system
MYTILFSPDAEGDLKALRKFEQKQVLEGVKDQLRYEPTVETRNRKQLDPNELAGWEVRLGRFRVFYNMDAQSLMVHVEAIGVKVGSILLIRGRRVNL